MASSGLITVPDVDLAPSDIRHAAIDAMTHERGFDFTIVCTGNASQAEYWQQRLDAVKGSVVPAHAIILVVDEDWAAGGAGNGLGTLYAYQKAAAAARSKHGIDLEAALREGKSVSLYHTAGKGTRLAPLPGSEANNKPGVKLAAMAKLVDGRASNMSILEAVILQTGIYASSRKGRISVFWGDQVFVPSYMQGSATEPLESASSTPNPSGRSTCSGRSQEKETPLPGASLVRHLRTSIAH